MTEFSHQPMFPLGKDDTEYRELSRDFVAADTVRQPVEFIASDRARMVPAPVTMPAGPCGIPNTAPA